MTITKELIIEELKRYLEFIDTHYSLFNELRHKILTRELTVEEFDIIFHLLNSITMELDTIRFALEVLE